MTIFSQLIAVLNGSRVIFDGPRYSPGFPRVASNLQTTAATAALTLGGDCPVAAGGPVARARLVSTMTAAAGESMTIDIFRVPVGGGPLVSILVAPGVFNNANAAGPLDLPVKPGLALDAGDALVASRTYVPGGAPTMTITGVFVDNAGDPNPLG